MKQDQQSAEVVQILLWYDKPEIILLKTGPIDFVLAVASGVGDNDEDAYVGASMTLAFLADYQAGKFDLRFALSHAIFRRYWRFVYRAGEKTVSLSRIKKTSELVSKSIPDAGFFSREHSPISVVSKFVPDAVETFDIDGTWDLGEFSSFYGQVEDIYYIFNDIRRFDDPTTTQKAKETISNALDRPWRGGGSYLGYYRSIANDNAPEAKLLVSGIKYNSPGYVSIKAKKKPFDDMIALLQNYAHRQVDVKKAYRALYGYMFNSKLLNREQVRTYVSPEVRATVERLAAELDRYMPGVSLDVFKRMSSGDVLVAAKVLLSVFRRMDKLFTFFEEGRVKYAAIETDLALEDDDLTIGGDQPEAL